MEGRNSAQNKLHNRRKLLALLRLEPMSRAALSRKMGLTRAAISQIVDAMIAEGVLRESTAYTSIPGPGRNPTLLKICDDAYYAVGISLRRSGCWVGISQLSGKVICNSRVELDNAQSTQHRLQTIARAVDALLKKAQIPQQRLLGAGVVAPGPVDSQTGTILNPPGFEGWENCPVGPMLSRMLNTQVYLENDANAGALYNYMELDFDHKDNFVLVHAEQGIGSGVISGGRLLGSTDGHSCELGHITIDFNGPLCGCGNRGCLELYASVDRVAARFGCQSWEALMDSAHRQEALETEARYLAAGLINLCNVVRVDAVLLGGRLRAFSDALLPMIRQKMQGRTLNGGPKAFLCAKQSTPGCVESACGVVFGRFLGVL